MHNIIGNQSLKCTLLHPCVDGRLICFCWFPIPARRHIYIQTAPTSLETFSLEKRKTASHGSLITRRLQNGTHDKKTNKFLFDYTCTYTSKMISY